MLTRRILNSYWPDGDGSALTLDFTTGVLDPRLTFTRSGTATFINASGVVATASTNTPRFDYDPTTGSPRGLLIEGTATNLLNWSESFATSGGTNNNWADTNITRNSTNNADPANGTTALRVTASAGNGTIISTAAIGTSAQRAFSIWLRRVSGTGNIQYTLDNGSTYTTQAITSSWVRYTFAATTAAQHVGIRIVTSGDSIELWGAQLEASSGASSYIPTGANQGTRNPDYCVMDGISSFFTSQSSLTMLIDATPRFQSGFPALWRLTDVGGGNGYELYYTSSGANNTYATKVSVGFAGSGESNFANSIAQDTRQIMGYAIASGVGFRSRNGVSASAQIPTSLPSAALTRLGIGSSGLSSSPSTAHIRRIKYWPYAMTQDQLNGVTTP